jgi:hypothetical protein
VAIHWTMRELPVGFFWGDNSVEDSLVEESDVSVS